MKKIFVLILLSISLSLTAQDSLTSNCACCSIEDKQFDFWVGEWNVFDTLGNYVGKNNVLKQYDNCLIQENWISAGKNRERAIIILTHQTALGINFGLIIKELSSN